MTRIGILSDTHGRLLPKVLDFLGQTDEIWHAGDIGSLEVLEEIQKLKPLRAVYGNIDGTALRSHCPENLVFQVEELKVFMTHIGGYPGRYHPQSKKIIELEKPGLFVCGHSHILKVIYDKKYSLLHINPGAAGNYGLHHSITAVRLKIEGKEMKNLEVLDITR
ncbi:MAG: metallophosphoesterase family protein [Bacteroidetes bacterium]|nr:metallophosphoesterase family protein [Bacteroidota bacterium]